MNLRLKVLLKFANLLVNSKIFFSYLEITENDNLKFSSIKHKPY